MSLPVQRLFRANSSLVRLSRRVISTEEVFRSCCSTPKNRRNILPRRGKGVASKQTPELRAHYSLNLTGNALKADNPKRIPTLHPFLQEGYDDGGHILQGKALEILDGGIPMWGEWGIPIRFDLSDRDSTSIFPNFWLRDNCRCSQCVNQDTMQRAFDTFMIPHNVLPKEVVTVKEGLRVTWDHENHTSLYTWDWLSKHGPRTASENVPGADKLENKDMYIYWGADIAENPPSVHYDEIMADEKGVGKWTDKITKYGFSYVDGCPVSPEKTQQLLERIAFIRITHYGGFYDFTSDLTMKDTAYTSLALGAHTDTTYFSDPAGLQMFHLLSHTDGSGGKSLLVDGFAAARKLKSMSKSAHEGLCKTPIPWHASGNEGITITPGKKFPVFTQADHSPGDLHPRMLQVRWNNDDRGVVALEEKDNMSAKKWYSAARLWSDILNVKEMQYWAQLEPGRPLIFDNWRVLHGRSSFTGKRRICGGYVNHDDFVSRWRNTNFTRNEVLKQIL